MKKTAGHWENELTPEPNLHYLLFYLKEGIYATVVAKYDFTSNRWVSTDDPNHFISTSIVLSVCKIEYPNIFSTGV